MPPLDTGSATHTLRLVDPLNDRAEPQPSDHTAVGAYLRAVREHRGRSLNDIALATRVSRAYLTALEEGDLSALPSRPFAIGYVRAYAKALELDEEQVVARFKAEAPDTSVPLQAPIGVKHDKPERRPLWAGVAAVVVIAVVGWNIAQRAVTTNEPPPPALPTVPAVADAPTTGGPIALGGPIAPPADQTTPAPYVTPGLDPATVANPGLAPPQPPAVNFAPILDRSAPPIFASRLPVNGVPAIGPVVVLQAKKPASLIVRGPTGAVHFARQLAAGEAYRAPIGQKLVAEVTDPGAFAVYINNQLQGGLAAPQTPLDRAVSTVLASMPKPAPTPAPAQPPAAGPAPAAGLAAPRPAVVTPRPAAPRPAPPRPAAVAPAPAPAAANVAPLTGAALGAPRPTGAPPAGQPAPAPSADAAEPPLF